MTQHERIVEGETDGNQINLQLRWERRRTGHPERAARRTWVRRAWGKAAEGEDSVGGGYEGQQMFLQFLGEGNVWTLAPEMEKLGILGATARTRRRPGEVSIKNWSFRRGLVINLPSCGGSS